MVGIESLGEGCTSRISPWKEESSAMRNGGDSEKEST